MKQFIEAGVLAVNRIGWVLACTIALGLGACGGGSGGSPSSPPPLASPRITTQPVSQSVIQGNSATFSVSANSSVSPLEFQWMRGGDSIKGANSSTLVLGNVQTGDDGSMYSVRVSNESGVIVSNTALLTVLQAPPPQAGTISVFAGSLGTINYFDFLVAHGPDSPTFVGVRGSADGAPGVARFANPAGLAIDAASNLYVADNGNNTIRKVSPQGQVSTLAGVAGTVGFADDSAPGVSATFSSPTGIAVDKNGTLYVTDGLKNIADSPPAFSLTAVRAITPAGQVSTLEFIPTRPSNVSGIAVDTALNIYTNGPNNVPVMPSVPARLNKFTPLGVSTYRASGYLGPSSSSVSIASLDSQGNLYTNFFNSIRKITPQGDIIKLAGPDYPAGIVSSDRQAGAVDGVGAAARFQIEKNDGVEPGAPRASMAVDSVGNVYLSDLYNHTIRKITPAGLVTTIAGKAGVPGLRLGALPGLLNRPAGLVLKGDKTLFVATDNVILKIDLQ